MKAKYGCPYATVNKKTLFEECKLTKQVTEGKADCDFTYDQCAHYKAKRGGQRSECVSCASFQGQ